ncbi:hypothetical protein MNBD_GAMMA07-751 [hydrothermal vent metagenome]|uniref:Uncharacterized protein n=1 Tax=hydrothermal vent metagenome TaxID=652676 RepID=A0A3B0X2L8_9ZZZZ
MNKSASILIKVIIFGILTVVGIIYVINQSPVENMATYEKQKMVKPNRGGGRSAISDFFSSDSKDDSAGDDMSLTGATGRYDEVRIGKKTED